MKVYVDANFVVGVYLRRRQDAARDLLGGLGEESPLPALTWLTKMEVINTIERSVFESRHGDAIRVPPEMAALAQAEFTASLENQTIFRELPVAVSDLSSEFENLALRHTANRGFRTYDILHVASAKVLECDAFWSFDRKARQLAGLEGLERN